MADLDDLFAQIPADQSVPGGGLGSLLGGGKK
jgi:hypothetical protein